MEGKMNLRLESLLILAVLLLGLPHPSHALAQTEVHATRGLHAVFSSTDSAGIVTDVAVDVTDGPDGSEAVIELSRFRPTCANNGCPQLLVHAFNRVPLDTGSIQISEELDSATVRANVPVHEPLVSGVDAVSLDLTWTGVGSLIRDDPDEAETFRDATASGTVRAGSANFTPEPSIDAYMEVG
jgi:hypothetical protein